MSQKIVVDEEINLLLLLFPRGAYTESLEIQGVQCWEDPEGWPWVIGIPEAG